MLAEQLYEVKAGSDLFRRRDDSILWILPGGDDMLRAFGIADEGTRMSDRVEARRIPRFKTSRALRIIPPEGEAILGTMQDISLGGMLVAVPVEVELGRTYRIEVTDSEGVFYLHGEALRLHLPPRSADGSQGSGFKIGFEFVGTDPAAGKRLIRLLEEAAA
jgi:hypothetical protein